MGERRVVFVAIGGTRRPGVIEAARRVVAAGGRATVIVGGLDGWGTFEPGVRVVAVAPMEDRRVPMLIERGLLDRAPVAVLRAAGRVAGRSRGEAVASAYRRRFADRVERRLTRPALRSVFGDIRLEIIRRELATERPQLLVIADAASLPLVAATALTCEITFNVGDAQPVDAGVDGRRDPSSSV